MTAPEIDDIWSRYLERDAISSKEEFSLLLTLEDDHPRRRELIQDEQIEGLLRSQGHCAVLEDQLIDQLSVRLNSLARLGHRARSDRLAPAHEDIVEVTSDGDGGPPLESNRPVGNPLRSTAGHVGFRPSTTVRGQSRRVARLWSLIGGVVIAALVLGVAIGYAVRGTSSDGDPISRSDAERNDRMDGLDAAFNPQSPNAAKSARGEGNHSDRKRGTPRVDGLSSETLARLNPSPDANWEIPVTEELKAQTLKLRSGTASVAFEGGATVQLRGRTQLRLVSTGRGLLLAGRLSVQVPRRAIGFTVDTPVVRIVDLGTEFNVDVDADGTTTVDVLRGRVELQPLISGGNPNRRQLSAGERVRIAPQSASRTGSSPPASGTGSKAAAAHQNPAGGDIVRGILIIDGQRFGYNSKAEYEQLRKRFPRLKPLHQPRTTGPDPTKRSPSPRNPIDGSGASSRKPNSAPADRSTKKPAVKTPAVKTLCGIDWHPDLNGAMKQAVRRNRPVMVFRVLGSLSGFM